MVGFICLIFTGNSLHVLENRQAVLNSRQCLFVFNWIQSIRNWLTNNMMIHYWAFCFTPSSSSPSSMRSIIKVRLNFKVPHFQLTSFCCSSQSTPISISSSSRQSCSITWRRSWSQCINMTIQLGWRKSRNRWTSGTIIWIQGETRNVFFTSLISHHRHPCSSAAILYRGYEK